MYNLKACQLDGPDKDTVCVNPYLTSTWLIFGTVTLVWHCVALVLASVAMRCNNRKLKERNKVHTRNIISEFESLQVFRTLDNVMKAVKREEFELCEQQQSK